MSEREIPKSGRPPLFGGGHTINLAMRPTEATWPCQDAVELISHVTRVGGAIYPAKPVRGHAPGLWERLAAAWLVLRGRAAAVRWMARD